MLNDTVFHLGWLRQDLKASLTCDSPNEKANEYVFTKFLEKAEDAGATTYRPSERSHR